jgi:hypothetical protein
LPSGTAAALRCEGAAARVWKRDWRFRSSLLRVGERSGEHSGRYRRLHVCALANSESSKATCRRVNASHPALAQDRQTSAFNEDFPAEALASYGIEAQHPDLFIDNLFDLDPAAVVAAAQRQRAALKNPPLDADHYLDVLLRQGPRPDCQGTRNLSRDFVIARFGC